MTSAATARRRTRALGLALALNVLIVIGQAVGGVAAHSLGLLADAAHNAVDAAGVLLALVAVRFARRPATAQRTFGYHRATILAGLANAAAIIAVTGWLAVEGVRRFLHPTPVAGGLVVAVATVSALLNTVAAAGVREPGGHDLNMRAALLHLAGDAVASAGVAAAGVVMLVTGGWYRLDAAVALAVGLLIAIQAVRLVRESVHVLLESAPAGLDLSAVAERMTGDAEVLGVHDLHVWSLSSEVRAMSAHVVLAGHPTLEQAQAVGDRVKSDLDRGFSIGHATLELECETCEMGNAAGVDRDPAAEVASEGAACRVDPAWLGQRLSG